MACSLLPTGKSGAPSQCPLVDDSICVDMLPNSGESGTYRFAIRVRGTVVRVRAQVHMYISRVSEKKKGKLIHKKTNKNKKRCPPPARTALRLARRNEPPGPEVKERDAACAARHGEQVLADDDRPDPRVVVRAREVSHAVDKRVPRVHQKHARVRSKGVRASRRGARNAHALWVGFLDW
jgi:hypothetical protein